MMVMVIAHIADCIYCDECAYNGDDQHHNHGQLVCKQVVGLYGRLIASQFIHKGQHGLHNGQHRHIVAPVLDAKNGDQHRKAGLQRQHGMVNDPAAL